VLSFHLLLLRFSWPVPKRVEMTQSSEAYPKPPTETCSVPTVLLATALD
jgi:hypothetical protein